MWFIYVSDEKTTLMGKSSAWVVQRHNILDITININIFVLINCYSTQFL